jgi:hypothetical protein
MALRDEIYNFIEKADVSQEDADIMSKKSTMYAGLAC